MTRTGNNPSPLRHQRGVVLIVALILLLVLTMIGVGVTQSTSLEERMAGNARDKDLAFQAAEAGLRGGEDGLLQALFTNFNNSAGQYEYDPTAAPIWTTVNWTDATKVIAYAGTPIAMSTGSTTQQLPQQPVFIVEQLPPVPAPGQNLGATEYGDAPTIQLFRITALGTGGDANAQAMLQTVFQP
ncbi:MAG TPA: PilX N-terminal domain-containing pilus assembly protein [Gammaproteobacteria bacterium]|nr:PilX N-terminal domain-containing pilus assembly protein [Gammaproteobacteria bacterium]